VVFDDQQLTYAELTARAHQLAHHLRRLGVGPDVIVAVLLERSLDLVVTLLGILAAGGAYLPLDPDHPAERLAFSIRDARAGLVVTRRASADRLGDHPARVVCLDGGAPSTDRDDAPAPLARPEHLAYVIYTSGSTGKPKGVPITHRAVVSFLRAMARTVSMDPGDAILAVTTVAFDIAVLELFQPLVSGARIVLCDGRQAADAGELRRLIDHHGITVMQATPTTWHMLVSAGWPGAPGLRVLCGGEALPASLAAELRRRGRALWNVYGPTEATVWASSAAVTDDDLAHATVVSIGRPLPGVTMHILDEALRPVPPGMPGELCIGGVQVARGYLGRPALTAERFVPDPFSPAPGARLYRTGDLARHRPSGDGAIDFLGRIDAQVKLRGYRIELGEIEAALDRHAQVEQAVVVLRDQRLAAYLVAAPGAAPAAAALREHLRRSLPEYMVPSSFSVLERLPLTASGKLDRKALPAPALRPGGHHVHPRSPLEWTVWTEMADVLHLDAFSVTDSFFDLGGHSLAAVHLTHRLSERCGRAVPLTAIFGHPTVADLAAWLVRGDAAAAETASPLVELQPGGGRPPMFWVHPAGGTAFCYAALSRALGPDQPFHAFQSPGFEPGTAPIADMDTLVRRYADLLQSRYPRGVIQLGGWSMGGMAAFELARHLAAAGRELAPVIVVDGYPSTDPAAGIAPAACMAAFLQSLDLSPADLGLDLLAGSEIEPTIDAVLARARELAAIPQSSTRDTVRRHFDVFSANLRASLACRPGRYDGDVVLVHSASTPPDRLASWAPLIGGRLQSIPIAGSHARLLSPPHVHVIAERLRALSAGQG
jgi:amino acid adenylation domain-containing protein